MNIKLTLGERLKDLRVERDLKLEALAEQTGLSKSALSKYEGDDVTDLSIYAVTTLAEFYGVTTDYLLGVTENKKRPDAVLSDLHLSDGAGRNAAAAGRRTYTIGSSESLRWVGRDRQLPRPSAHSSAAEQVLAGVSRSPFSASAGTKV